MLGLNTKTCTNKKGNYISNQSIYYCSTFDVLCQVMLSWLVCQENYKLYVIRTLNLNKTFYKIRIFLSKIILRICYARLD